jgi:hypothetical protein
MSYEPNQASGRVVDRICSAAAAVLLLVLPSLTPSPMLLLLLQLHQLLLSD